MRAEISHTVIGLGRGGFGYGADGIGKDLDKVRRFVTAAKLTTSRQ
jgi:hypothetical protein